MLTIYLEEAHAVDDWAVPLSRRTGGHIRLAKNINQRIAAAKSFIADNNYPGEVVCDCMSNNVGIAFDAWPERLFIVDEGILVYKGGKGPFDYKPEEVLAWLQNRWS